MKQNASNPHHRMLALSALLPLLACAALVLGGCPIFGDGGDNSNDNTSNSNDNTAPPPPGDSGLTGKYIGSHRCATCHANIHSTWDATLHPGALDTLEAIGQGTNSVCLPCHTVGFGQPGGYVDRATTNSLAGVGCENCHGPGGDHVANINDESLRPPVNIASSVCGTCHTGEHHPNYEDWQASKHAAVEPELVPRFAAGTSLSSCGVCHSGDYFYRAVIKGESVPENALQGLTGDQMNAITCAICHDPHAKTGNAAAPEDGRDYQLRYPQVKFTTPSTSVADATNPDRFNICGQCHHARDRVWTDGSREPHPSDQANVFFGEMPLPASDQNPIVPVRSSVHLNTPEQCSTCHVVRKPFEEGIAPAVSGHTFELNVEGCAECHGTAEIAQARLEALEIEIEWRAEQVHHALNAWGASHDVQGKGQLSWEYTSEGGPNASGQNRIPNAIKKARYIYYYVIAGGGNGAHNPDYVRDALIYALDYVNTNPPLNP